MPFDAVGRDLSAEIAIKGWLARRCRTAWRHNPNAELRICSSESILKVSYVLK